MSALYEYRHSTHKNVPRHTRLSVKAGKEPTGKITSLVAKSWTKNLVGIFPGHYSDSLKNFFLSERREASFGDCVLLTGRHPQEEAFTGF